MRAAEIYRELVEAVFARLPRDVEILVFYDPAERRNDIAAWLNATAGDRTVQLLPQAGGDLGQRLESAFHEAFALGCGQAAAIGTDCLDLDGGLFTQTWDALKTHDVVLGPSEDGGYYLVALSTPRAPLFRDIAWSTDQVLAQTLALAAKEALRVHLLPEFLDVDTEQDWRRAELRLRS